MRISDWSSDVCSSNLVPQLQRIVNAYAPKKIREGQQIVWALDARMAEIIRSTSEPMIGQMRLTWWHEALTKDPKAGGSGEPLMAALRRQGLPLSGGESLLSIIVEIGRASCRERVCQYG